jgi:hypothetical protein
VEEASVTAVVVEAAEVSVIEEVAVAASEEEEASAIAVVVEVIEAVVAAEASAAVVAEEEVVEEALVPLVVHPKLWSLLMRDSRAFMLLKVKKMLSSLKI